MLHMMQQPMRAAYLPIGTVVNVGRPPNSIGGRPEKNFWWGTLLDHITKLYTNGQLTADNPVSRSCQTRHGRTNEQTN